VPKEAGDQRRPGGDRQPRPARAETAGAIGLGEAEDQQRQARREQHHPQPVELVGGLRPVALEHDLGEDDGDDPDRHVDEEDPAPGDVVDEPAAEDR
jgi:hypothetical protein